MAGMGWMSLASGFVLLNGASGHGAMYEPLPRSSRGSSFMGPSCSGGSCLFFVEGTGIGCDTVAGKTNLGSTIFGPCKDGRKSAAKPTIPFRDGELGTYNVRGARPIHPTTWLDWSNLRPWRFPGSAPVLDPCGVAGGGFHDGKPRNGARPPWGIPIGTFGSTLPPLIKETVWIAGTEAEVAWGVQANHGGGYQYRLCPADAELTEECFQSNPLAFVGDTQWLQYGPDGLDRRNRTEIKAHRVSEGVVPNGSTWTRNPIPACGDSIYAGACDIHRPRPLHCTHAGQFPPPAPGAHGFGGAACLFEARDLKFHERCRCSAQEFGEKSLQFGIVDKVRVPLEPGKYVLSWRWDTEQTPQVWGQCADVTIVEAGNRPATTPFERYSGCEACCAVTKGICSNCSQCLKNTSGDCKYCWTPLDGFHPAHVPRAQCLGHEDESGGAPLWFPGDDVGMWSPGCPKCWAEGVCEAAAAARVTTV